MTVQEFVELVEEVIEDLEREKDQALLKDSIELAKTALAGQHACERVIRRVEARSGVPVLRKFKRGRAR